MSKKEEIQGLCLSLAQAAYDKKGDEITLLDMEGISYVSDFFLIVTAANRKQAQSIADEICDKGAEEGLAMRHIEGYKEGDWVLIDLGDVVCHVFTGEMRRFYGLEQLWNDAKKVPFEGK